MKRPYQHVSLSRVKAFTAFRCEPVHVGMQLETDPDSYAWNNRKRGKFSLFQYTLRGEGCFTAGTRTLPVKEGQAFLVNCPSNTSYRLPPGRTWELLYLIFVGDMARHHAARLIARHGHVLNLAHSSPAVELLMRLYDEACAGRVLDKYSLSETLYRFLMELYRELDPREDVPAGIQRAIGQIEQDYRNPLLSLGMLADRAGLSPFHFSRLFRKHAGVTPHAYLQQVRMDHATDHLISTGLSIKEISRLVGFNDYSYFCRAFRRHHGVTPGAARGRPA